MNGKPGDIVEYCVMATHPGVGTSDATVADFKDTLTTTLTLVTTRHLRDSTHCRSPGQVGRPPALKC